MLKKLLSLLSDVFIYGIAGVLSQVIGLLLLPLYVDHLTTAEYGVAAVANLVALIYVPLANLGMTNAIFRRFNTCKEPEQRTAVLSTGFVAVLTSTAILGSLLLLLAAPLGVLILNVERAPLYFAIAIVTAMFTSVNEVFQVVLRADRRVKTTSAVSLVALLVTVLTTIWLVVFQQLNILGLLLGALAGAVAACLVLVTLTWGAVRFRFDRQLWREMLHYALPIVPHQVQSVGLAMIGQYIVFDLLGEAEGGLYATAIKVATPVAFAVDAVQRAWVPIKFQMHAQDDDPAGFFRTATTYYFATVFYLWVGVSLWGMELLPYYLPNPAFWPAAWLIPPVAFIAVSRGIRFMLATGMEVGRTLRGVPTITFIGLMTVLIGCFTLIKPLGAAGAALATSLGWIVMATITYFVAQRRFRVPYDWFAIGSMALVAALFVGLGYAIQMSLDSPYRLGLTLLLSILYPLIVLAILMRSRSERERMQVLLKRIRKLRTKGKRNKPAANDGTEPAQGDDMATLAKPQGASHEVSTT